MTNTDLYETIRRGDITVGGTIISVCWLYWHLYYHPRLQRRCCQYPILEPGGCKGLSWQSSMGGGKRGWFCMRARGAHACLLVRALRAQVLATHVKRAMHTCTLNHWLCGPVLNGPQPGRRPRGWGTPELKDCILLLYGYNFSCLKCQLLFLYFLK